MKKLVLLIFLFTMGFLQVVFAQNTNSIAPISSVLPAYFKLKDAFVASNSADGTRRAAELLKLVSKADFKLPDATSLESLVNPLQKIVKSTDLKVQRENFAELSEAMVILTKSSKLSTNPVYQMYCPMKKANWLSAEKTVKNPYYGSTMLNCGKIAETIQ